jgi:hypothetical protein
MWSVTPPAALIARQVRPLVLEALAENRATALLGARQVGKSTLAQSLAENEFPARYISLDDEASLDAARADPRGFIAGISERVVIDEIQRAPRLLLAIKERLDRDQTRGQFLLTGSANIQALPTVADALPGRVEYVKLWPLSQGELRGAPEQFIDTLFRGSLPQVSNAPVGRLPVVSLLSAGGYPELVGRGARGRSRFFSSYVESMIGRDIGDIANLRNVENVERLLYLFAARSGGLANFQSMASELGLDAHTVRSHTKILEDLFLIRRLKPWFANLGSRHVKTPKLYVVDSGLLAFLIRANERRIAEDEAIFGMMLESFVAMELLRQSDWAQELVTLFHYRDKEQREVDVVMESDGGEVVGVEVKATATPSRKDFAGLRYLRDRLGTRFKAGVVLYTGSDTLPFGDRIAAVPLSGLWAS